jgi:hypothetical protein
MKHGNLENILKDGSDTVHTVLQSMDFWNNAAFIEYIHPRNLHTAVMDKNVISQPWKHRSYCRIRTRIRTKKIVCDREEIWKCLLFFTCNLLEVSLFIHGVVFPQFHKNLIIVENPPLHYAIS